MKSLECSGMARIVVAAWMAAAVGPALAQTEMPAPEVSASAPLRTLPKGAPKPGPRPMSPAEVRDSPQTTGELRSQPVTRQISIPFGKKPPPPPKSESDAAARAAANARGGVDDAEARCQAEVDDSARELCRRKIPGSAAKP